ncbi:MAG: hypothetical protein KDI63_09530 [Gammaproteobacteria bacterium]|nr:hypothetical protein [Gammaproteobacteria bacterium]
MKKRYLAVCMALSVAACSMDEESKAKLEQAASHAKQAAKEVGEVVSAKTSEVGEKWRDMNANRIEETPKEDPNLPTQEADVGDLKARIKAAKDAFMKDPQKTEATAEGTQKGG